MAKKQAKVEKTEETKLDDFINPESTELDPEKKTEEVKTENSETSHQNEAVQPEEIKEEPQPDTQPDVGDPCPNKKCPGSLSEYSRHRSDKYLTQFLCCSKCNAKPEPSKRVTPSY